MTMDQAARRIEENVRSIRQRIAEAARRVGRSEDEITVVAVTKYVGADLARALFAAGLRDLGESRPQQLWPKAEQLQDLAIRWHLIGHLQRNKIRRTLPFVSLLHSGDSWRLLTALNEEARRIAHIIPVLLEVNVSGDAGKHGFSPAQLQQSLDDLPSLENLRIRGLMTMASRIGGAQAARADFIQLRELRDQWSSVSPQQMEWAELSMGMSSDFEVAIEEGSTMVRIGSAFFEGVVG